MQLPFEEQEPLRFSQGLEVISYANQPKVKANRKIFLLKSPLAFLVGSWHLQEQVSWCEKKTAWYQLLQGLSLQVQCGWEPGKSILVSAGRTFHSILEICDILAKLSAELRNIYTVAWDH